MAGKVIATCGGYELIEDGPRLLFVNRGSSWYSVALFVVGLLAVITSANGVFWLVAGLSSDGGGFGVALALLPLAAVFVTVFILLWRAQARSAKEGFRSEHIILVADRARNALTDSGGRPLASLDGAVFRSAMQVTSSSRCLEVIFAGGAQVVARGSPFSGSIGGFQKALRERDLRVT